MPKRPRPTYDEIELDDRIDADADRAGDDEPGADEVAAPSVSPLEWTAALLQSLSAEQLRAIAIRRGWNLPPARRDKLAEQIANLLAEEPRPATFAEEEAQYAALFNTLYGVDLVIEEHFLRSLWKRRVGGDMKRLDRAVQGLQDAGVLFACDRADGPGHHLHWSPLLHSQELPLLAPQVKLYPTEKVERLTAPAVVPAPGAIADALIELASRESLHTHPRRRDARFDRHPATGDWDYDPRELQGATGWRSRDVYAPVLTVPLDALWYDETAAMLESLAGGSRELGMWVASTLLSAGIVQPGGEALATLVPAEADGWQSQPPEVHHIYFWESWRRGADALLELRVAARRAGFAVQRAGFERNFTPPVLFREIGLAREFVCRLLTPLTPGVWYSYKSFAEWVRNVRPDFLHTLTEAETWFLAAAKTHHRYDLNRTSDWDAVGRPVLAAMLQNVPYWLGAVELRYEGQDLAAFRITPLGAWLLTNGVRGGFAEPAAAPGAAGESVARWIDDTTLRLSAHSEATRLLPLVRAFAEPAREALTFRVTPAAITRALERGIGIPEIAGKLAAAGAPLPPVLRERMDALAANYGRIHLYERLTVLELGDDYALRELLAGTTLGEHIVHQFSPRLVVVRDEAVDALVKEMLSKGYTPRVTDRVNDGGA